MSLVFETNLGNFEVELFEKEAPISAKNFQEYVDEGYFDGLIFHRVIPGFMIQGGGFEPGMKQKPTRGPVANEAGNGLKNAKYTVAMARTSDPHSATAQFFINVGDNAFLDFKSPGGNGWGYTVFVKVVEGQDVVDKIKGVATARSGHHENVPTSDVVIKSAEVVG